MLEKVDLDQSLSKAEFERELPALKERLYDAQKSAWDADIPVVQLAINALEPFEYHLQLGAALAPLRERGVVIMGSGNVVHNLRLIDWSQPDAAFDWAIEFDEKARAVMTTDPGDLARLRHESTYAHAVPTPDHFIPLLYVAGVAAASGTNASTLVDGYTMGSLSMTA